MRVARERLGLAAAWALLSVFAAAPAGAQTESVRGRLHLVWDGNAAGERVEYLLTDPATGRTTRLGVTDARARELGLLALDRRLVQATIARQAAVATEPFAGAADLVAIRSVEGEVTVAAASPIALDFVTILCRFADDPRTPFLHGSVGTVHGGTYPGLAYHFREMSGDASLMAGSVIVGWYDLPLPRSGYVSAGSANYVGLAQDCAALAQSDVDFTQFHGVNVQLNGAMQTRSTPPYDTLSFGGSATLTLDGVTRSWGVTWLSGIHATNYVVVHHEVGHAVGWPHSSGDYGQEYDSHWDIMSRGYLRFEAPWGWQGIHTIMPHKWSQGWLSPDRVLEPPPGSITRGRLARSAVPPAGGYLMARVPGTAGTWYSAESRLPYGLDQPLPASAVILHKVKFGIRSYVVDPDGNGNPNDENAQWIPGEEFADAEAGFSLRVDSAFVDAFAVTVTRGWRVEARVEGTGSVSLTAPSQAPVTCADRCEAVVATRGSVVRIEAVPGPERAFAGWLGACTGSSPCDLAVTQNAVVTARFVSQPVLASSTLGAGIMGGTYSDGLDVEGDGIGYSWSVVAGELPPGLTLDVTTGRLAGIPAASGTFAFTLRVSAGMFSAEQATSITVTKPALALDAVIAAALGGPPLSIVGQRFLDLLGNANGRVDVGDVRAWLLDSAELSPPQRAAAIRALGARAERR